MNCMMYILLLHHFIKRHWLLLDVSTGLYFVQVMLKKTSPLRHVNRVKYAHQEEFLWDEVLQDSSKVQEV